MSTTTAIVNFTEHVGSFVEMCILPHIIEWYKIHRNVQATSSELMSALNIPIVKQTQIQVGMPNLPNFIASKTPTKKGSTRLNKKKGMNIPDPNCVPCIYVFQRGDKKDQPCGLPSVENTSYCKDCIKKKSVRDQLNKTGVTVDNSSKGFGTTFVAPQHAQRELSVIPIPNRPGFYEEQEFHFIVEQLSDHTIVALSVKEGKNERPLTEQEKEIAKSRGMAIPVGDDEEEEQEIEMPPIEEVKTVIQGPLLQGLRPLPPLIRKQN